MKVSHGWLRLLLVVKQILDVALSLVNGLLLLHHVLQIFLLLEDTDLLLSMVCSGTVHIVLLLLVGLLDVAVLSDHVVFRHNLLLKPLVHVDWLGNFHVVVGVFVLHRLSLVVLGRVEGILGQNLLARHVEALEEEVRLHGSDHILFLL